MNKTKVLVICGSLRKESFNCKLLKIAENFALEAGAEVNELNLKSLNLPIYDGDLEAAGMPEQVKKLKNIIEGSDVFLIGSPEHNYSITASLKNAIDWASRGEKNSWGGKVAAIFGASNGPMGTLRGQFHLRQILSAVNVTILPQPQIFISVADDTFLADGSLKDKATAQILNKLIKKTIDASLKLK